MFRLFMIAIVFQLLLLCVQVFPLTFDEYMVKFSRTYGSPEEKVMRETLYYRRVAEWEQFNSQAHGYTLGPTTFADRTEQEISEMINNPFDEASYSLAKPYVSSKQNLQVSAPTSVDWRAMNGVSSVKDQGYCGSCWAFAAVASTQSYFMIKNSLPVDLSEEYVLQCTNKSAGANTCNGGYPYDAFSLILRTGLPLQSQYPYSAYYYSGYTYPATVACAASTASFRKFPSQYQITYYYYSVTANDLKQMLQTGTLTVYFMAEPSFMYYQGNGVYSCSFDPSIYYLNHAVQLVGYNSTGNYWIIKNSWGVTWGDNGFGYISMSWDCGIKVYAFHVKAKQAQKPKDPDPVNPTNNSQFGLLLLAIVCSSILMM